MRVPLILVALIGALAACRGSGEESCLATEHDDLSGTWELTMTVTADSCDPEDVGDEDFEVVTVTQEGRRISVDFGGMLLQGSVCGDSFSAQGSESATFFGCVGSETISASGVVDGDQLDGSSRFQTSTNGHEDCLGLGSCTGAYSLLGQRL